jgi:hypothetical protein
MRRQHRRVREEHRDGMVGDGQDATDRNGTGRPRNVSEDPSSDADDRRHRGDRADQPEFHEPAPAPTAFGASTVGGAVAASALAGDRRDPRTEETVRPGDGVAEDRVDGIDEG